MLTPSPQRRCCPGTAARSQSLQRIELLASIGFAGFGLRLLEVVLIVAASVGAVPQRRVRSTQVEQNDGIRIDRPEPFEQRERRRVFFGLVTGEREIEQPCGIGLLGGGGAEAGEGRNPWWEPAGCQRRPAPLLRRLCAVPRRTRRRTLAERTTANVHCRPRSCWREAVCARMARAPMSEIIEVPARFGRGGACGIRPIFYYWSYDKKRPAVARGAPGRLRRL